MRKWWKRGKTWREKTCQTTVGQLPRDNLFLELVSISTSAHHPFFSHFLLSLTLASLHLRTANRNSKPFTLKLRTKQIKICQSCRKDYEGENDTLGLVVARPERKWISNPVTGAQFWGKESNSHYHAHVMCLKKAESSFEIEIPKELIPKLTIFQKVYLMTCLNVPPMKLDLEV